MRKSKLLALPIAQPDTLPADGRIIKYNACARIHDLDGKMILVIDFFDANCSSLLHRVFMTRTEYLTASFEPPQRACKWRTAKMETFLTDYKYPDGYIYPIPDRQSKSHIDTFLGCPSDDPIKSIFEYQHDLEAVRRRMKHQKEMDKIREIMRGVKPLPEGFVDWLDTSVMKGSQYMIYQRRGKKQRGFCSVCTSVVDMQGLKHRQACVCPECNSSLTAIADGKMKNGRISDTEYAGYIQALGDSVMVRTFRVIRELNRHDGQWGIITRHSEVFRDILGAKGQYSAYISGYYRHDVDNGLDFVPPVMTSYLDYHRPSTLYPHGIREELKNTFARYSGIECMAQKCIPFRADFYLHFYDKYPQIEMLARRGAFRFARMLAEEYRSHPLKELDTIRRHFNELEDGDERAVEIFGIVDASPYGATAEDVARFRAQAYNLSRALQFVPLSKLNSYLEQMERPPYGKNCSYALSDLADYWETASKIGMDMKDKRVLFPTDLKAAHDKAVRQFKIVKDKRVEQLLKERYASEAEKYSFQSFGLCLIYPRTVADFIHESEKLCHCVRTYAEKAAFRETTILFIREAQSPNTPFYTMEIRDGRVIQLRGKHNSNPTKDVLNFEEEFCKALGLKSLAA